MRTAAKIEEAGGCPQNIILSPELQAKMTAARGLCYVGDPNNLRYGLPHIPVEGKLDCDKSGNGGLKCWTCVSCGAFLTDRFEYFVCD